MHVLFVRSVGWGETSLSQIPRTGLLGEGVAEVASFHTPMDFRRTLGPSWSRLEVTEARLHAILESFGGMSFAILSHVVLP